MLGRVVTTLYTNGFAGCDHLQGRSSTAEATWENFCSIPFPYLSVDGVVSCAAFWCHRVAILRTAFRRDWRDERQRLKAALLSGRFRFGLREKASFCRINHLALDILIILLYRYMLQVRQDEHHDLAT